MKTIPLTKGKVAFVSDRDYARVKRVGKWQAFWNGKHWYAVHGFWKRNVYLHRFVLNAPDRINVDHVKRDETLNCTRRNIRLATPGDNQHNRGKPKNNTSGYKGVSFAKSLEKWTAQISVNGKRIHIGDFNTPEQAARAYNRKAKKYFGRFAYLNPLPPAKVTD